MFHARHIISQLSGFYAFADEPQTTRMLWNRVSHVPGQPKQLSIPLGWREGHLAGLVDQLRQVDEKTPLRSLFWNAERGLAESRPLSCIRLCSWLTHSVLHQHLLAVFICRLSAVFRHYGPGGK